MKINGYASGREFLIPGTYWQLNTSVNCFANGNSKELVTQASSGRSFQVLDQPRKTFQEKPPKRLKVKLLEDGYQCWINFSDILGHIFDRGPWQPELLSYGTITDRLPLVLAWIEKAASKPNQYLWGGTLGPDFDCSGLVQTAFASVNIWLPRDAYQQEEFCYELPCNPENLTSLTPGDLLFFGGWQRCDHVGVYRGEGFYWHSSGKDFGHNGISSDCLKPRDQSHIACHYRKKFRRAGRIKSCHDGSTLA